MSNERYFEISFTVTTEISVPEGAEPADFIEEHIVEIAEQAAYNAAEHIGWNAGSGYYRFEEV